MKLIVAGSRSIYNYKLVKQELNELLRDQDRTQVVIVSGTAWGADRLGERYAAEHGYCIQRFPANWSRFGKTAGFIRNEEMAKYATDCIVFWDGKSKGTKHMIKMAEKYNLKLKIVAAK